MCFRCVWVCLGVFLGGIVCAWVRLGVFVCVWVCFWVCFWVCLCVLGCISFTSSPTLPLLGVLPSPFSFLSSFFTACALPIFTLLFIPLLASSWCSPFPYLSSVTRPYFALLLKIGPKRIPGLHHNFNLIDPLYGFCSHLISSLHARNYSFCSSSLRSFCFCISVMLFFTLYY